MAGNEIVIAFPSPLVAVKRPEVVPPEPGPVGAPRCAAAAVRLSVIMCQVCDGSSHKRCCSCSV